MFRVATLRAGDAAPPSSKVPAPAPPQSGAVQSGLPPEALPERYGETLLILQARDPHWVHAYWEIVPPAPAGPHALRVYELAGSSFTASAIRRAWDVPVTPDARDWFVEVGRPATWWGFELGAIGPDGRFTMIVRSNVVETPAYAPSTAASSWRRRPVP